MLNPYGEPLTGESIESVGVARICLRDSGAGRVGRTRRVFGSASGTRRIEENDVEVDSKTSK